VSRGQCNGSPRPSARVKFACPIADKERSICKIVRFSQRFYTKVAPTLMRWNPAHVGRTAVVSVLLSLRLKVGDNSLSNSEVSLIGAIFTRSHYPETGFVLAINRDFSLPRGILSCHSEKTTSPLPHKKTKENCPCV
jgi:hypothetical protein